MFRTGGAAGVGAAAAASAVHDVTATGSRSGWGDPTLDCGVSKAVPAGLEAALRLRESGGLFMSDQGICQRTDIWACRPPVA